MPGKVKVRVVAGRNLPVMDRSSDTTDAYVEVKLGNITHKTDVFRKSLNPQWNSEWFRFEVHDLELQDEPLQIRLMDHDTYSANDAIGKVYVDLNPLLLPPLNAIQAQRHAHEPTQPGRAEMSGWLPVYDTMHGIRGEVNIIVKVDLFSDFNKFRQSSCGVQFFFTPGIPVGHRCQNILGFVEELVVNDDPEYQWIDKIRTPRASNEARQTLFSKLSGELQRRIGLKVLELGGNAVIGYRQCFDLEGESGIVVRGLGSAVTLVRLQHDSHCSTGGGTMHSPSPLRDIQGQRDSDEDEIVLENMYVSIPNSNEPMPISIVRIPKRMSAYYSASSSINPSRRSSTYSCHESPVQWLDLMVSPGGAYGRNLPQKVNLSNANKYIRGLPHHVKRHRSFSLRPNQPSGSRKNSFSKQNILSNSTSDSLDNIKAGLKRTARRMISFRESSEKAKISESSVKSYARPGKSIRNSASMKVIRLLARTKSKTSKLQQSQVKIYEKRLEEFQESLKNDECQDFEEEHTDNEEYMDEDEDEDEDDMFYDNDTEEDDIDISCMDETNIEYSLKRLSSAISDPTLHRSIFAQQWLKNNQDYQDSIRPIEFVSSEEEPCDSMTASSNICNPDVSSQFNITPSFTQHFFLPKDEDTISTNSSASLDSHFTGPVDRWEFPDGARTISESWSVEVQPDRPDDLKGKKVEFLPQKVEITPHVLETGAIESIRPRCNTEGHYQHSKKKFSKSQSFDADCKGSKDDSVIGRFKGIKENTTPVVQRKMGVGVSLSEVLLQHLKGGSALGYLNKEQHLHDIKIDTETEGSNKSGLTDNTNPKQLNDRINTVRRNSCNKDEIVKQENIHKQDNMRRNSASKDEIVKQENVNKKQSLRKKSLVKEFAKKKSEEIESFQSKKPIEKIEKMLRQISLKKYSKKKDAINEYPEVEISSEVTIHESVELNIEESRDIKRKIPPSTLNFSTLPLPGINLIPSTPELERFHGILDFPEEESVLSSLDVNVVSNIPSPDSSNLLKVDSKVMASNPNLSTPSFPSSSVSSSSSSSHSPISPSSRPSGSDGVVPLSPIDCSSAISSSSPVGLPNVGYCSSDGSMDTNARELLESALLDVVAKCPSHPVYISSLDLLVEARPASASMMDSPKRVGHSRSRHTSGHYPISRSPLPIENLAAAVEVKDSAVNGGVTSSPTHSGKISSPHRSSQSEAIKRGSSDSDLSITPKGSPNPTSGSIAGSGGSSICGVRGGPMPTGAHRPVMTQESFDMLEYPFLTMKSFPEGFIMHLGGTVSARSVKSLDRPHNQEEAETRDNWWTQIRMEIRSHSRALACNIVLGYEEFTTISDEVCVLNATGTAAVINLSHLDNDTANNSGYATRNPRDPMTFSLEKKDLELKDPPQSAGKTSTCKESHMGSQGIMSRSHGGMESDLSPATEAGTTSGSVAAGGGSSGGVVAAGGSSSGGGVAAGGSSSGGGVVAGGSSSGGGSSGGTTAGLIGSGGIVSGPLTTPNQTQQQTQVPYSPCQLCHVPYSETSLPFKVKITKCAICRRGKVPDVLFTTLEPPPNIPITGRGCLIQARVSRQKRDLRGELNAKEISDSLPFLEYELHKQLVNKMKIKGMNALFGLRVRVTVGERLIIGIATATAVFLSALQPPPVPKVTSHGLGRDDERRRMDAQKLLQTTIDRNKECYGTKNVISEITVDEMNGSRGSDTEDSEDDLPEIDLSSGNKETCVLELDDLEDAEMIGLLLGSCNPNSLTAVSTERPPGLPTEQIVTNLQMFTRVWRTKVPTNLNPAIFNLYFDKLMQSIYFKVRKLSPCILAGLKFDCELPEEDEIQIAILGMVLGQGPPSSQQPLANHQRHERHGSRDHQHKKAKQEDSDMIFNMEEVVHSTEEMGKSKPSTQSLPGMLHSAKTANRSLPYSGGHSGPPSGASSTRSSIKSKGGEQRITNYHCIPREHYGVEISPLSFIPGARIERHLGNLNFFFIRESTSIKEAGGLSGFMGSFVTEVLALVRAHVAALGGNAMISYFMSECVLLHNPYKNQGQCLINIGGDVVQVSYSSATTGTAFADTSAVEE